MTASSPSEGRKNLSKKLRFEVFKRDSFACQYCGAKAPDVVLHVDHIEPVSEAGTNDLLNLITSCEDCNSGKSNRRLSDDAVLERQREKLARLQERKEQIEMMFEWQQSLLDLDAQTLNRLADVWAEKVPGYRLTDQGEAMLKKWLKRFGLEELISAMHTAADQYLRFNDEGQPTKESVENAWQKVGGICVVRQRERSDPGVSRPYYIRAILRNRLHYCDERSAMKHLQDAISLGITAEELENLAKEVRNWTDWRTTIEAWIREAEDGGETDG